MLKNMTGVFDGCLPFAFKYADSIGAVAFFVGVANYIVIVNIYVYPIGTVYVGGLNSNEDRAGARILMIALSEDAFSSGI